MAVPGGTQEVEGTMAIMRWDPFGELLSMQSDMDRLFRRLGGPTETPTGQRLSGWMPRIDVKQRGDDLVIHADLAGVKPEDVDISVTDGVLTISGERSAEKEREDENWVVRERSYGSFQRQMALPEGVDPSTIHADFKDGVLIVDVPRALEAAKPATTKIAIGMAPTEESPTVAPKVEAVPPAKPTETAQPSLHH
jgi:HSP20 family protein